jgi:hypothetical protein
MIKAIRFIGVAVALLISVAPLLGQEKKDPPSSFSGRLMSYEAKKGTVTHISALQPTPQGKFLQEVYELTVNRNTKFIYMEGDNKTELDSKTILTDAKTKDLFVGKPGSTLNNNEGISAEFETKGRTATKVTIKKKKK